MLSPLESVELDPVPSGPEMIQHLLLMSRFDLNVFIVRAFMGAFRGNYSPWKKGGAGGGVRGVCVCVCVCVCVVITHK